MKYLFAAVLAVLVIAPAHAGDKITNRQAIELLEGLSQLDGYPSIVKDQVVPKPYEFGNGTLRGIISRDIAILRPIAKMIDDVRNGVLRELLKDKPGITEVKRNTPEFFELLKQLDPVLDAPASGTQDLEHFKIADLKLEKNEIPGTVLASIKVICDQ